MTEPNTDLDPDDLLEVISVEAAIEHIAALNEPPQAEYLFHHRQIVDGSGYSDVDEVEGRHSLATELLIDLIEAGRVRTFGRKTSAVDKNGISVWGDLSNYVRIPPNEVAAMEWTNEEFEDQSMMGFSGNAAGYWALLVALDDLMSAFPGRDFEVMRKPDYLRLSIASTPTEESNELEKTPAESTTDLPKRSTSGAIQRCIKWIESQAEKGYRPKSRESMYVEARSIIGDSLSQRGFNAAWQHAAPEEWKSPGRKPRRESSADETG